MAATRQAEERKRLRTLVTDLRTTLVSSMGPHQRAYAELTEGAEVQPWTAAAEEIWTEVDDGDPWHYHHLAILYHARAYDLELRGSEEALEYWAAALTCWRTLLEDDAFWTAMASHLRDHMGMEVSPDLVPSVRTGLVRKLLAPHVELISSHKSRSPARARRHLDLIKASGYDPEVVEDIRVSMVRDVVGAVPDAVESGSHDQIIADLRSWLEIDSDNRSVVQALLFVYRKRSERLWNETDGFTKIADNVRKADAVLGSILKSMSSPTGALAREMARHTYWRAFALWHHGRQGFAIEASRSVIESVDKDAKAAVKLYGQARELDEALALDSYYEDIDMLEAQAVKLSGMCCFVTRKPNGEIDHVGAAQHCRRAIRLNADDFEAYYFLVKALLAQPTPSEGALAEAETVLARGKHAAQSPDEIQAYEQLTSQLAIRRRMSRMQSGGPKSLEPEDLIALLRQIQRNA